MEIQNGLPEGLEALIACGAARADEFARTQDGFILDMSPLSERLRRGGVSALIGSSGQEMPCERFYDDWHLYTAFGTYGLVKLREQEHDAENGLRADGDTPGVTVSFIAFDISRLTDCLRAAGVDERRALAAEIDRTVAQRGQMHDAALKAYFVRPQAEGPYLIAKMYCRHAAGFAQGGKLPVPQKYAKQRKNRGMKRLERFLAQNNERAGRTVCDGEMLFIGAAEALTREEILAVLATHTANVSLNSFAAEVCMHARFLKRWLRLPGGVWLPYESAVRADMTVDGADRMAFAPYYRLKSRCVRRQAKFHGEM